MGQIMRQPVFFVATLGAAIGYGVMNLLMAATPLVMDVHHFEFGSIALVLQWHVIGMYAPGFFTGHLIRRWGVLTVMGLGVMLIVGRSEEHTSELQSLMRISYAVFCLKKKKIGYSYKNNIRKVQYNMIA